MSRHAADVILETGRRGGFMPGCFAVIHTWGRDQQWHPQIHLSTTADGVTNNNTRQFYVRTVMLMWSWRITDLLRREYYRLVIPESLTAGSRSRREWNHILRRHYRQAWNVRVSNIMDNVTHLAMCFGFYLKKSPVA